MGETEKLKPLNGKNIHYNFPSHYPPLLLVMRPLEHSHLVDGAKDQQFHC